MLAETSRRRLKKFLSNGEWDNKFEIEDGLKIIDDCETAFYLRIPEDYSVSKEFSKVHNYKNLLFDEIKFNDLERFGSYEISPGLINTKYKGEKNKVLEIIRSARSVLRKVKEDEKVPENCIKETYDFFDNLAEKCLKQIPSHGGCFGFSGFAA